MIWQFGRWQEMLIAVMPDSVHVIIAPAPKERPTSTVAEQIASVVMAYSNGT